MGLCILDVWIFELSRDSISFADANRCMLMLWEKAEEEERRVALSRMHASTIISESMGDVKLWADASPREC